MPNPHCNSEVDFIVIWFVRSVESGVLQAGFSNVFITFVRIAVISGPHTRSDAGDTSAENESTPNNFQYNMMAVIGIRK